MEINIFRRIKEEWRKAIFLFLSGVNLINQLNPELSAEVIIKGVSRRCQYYSFNGAVSFLEVFYLNKSDDDHKFIFIRFLHRKRSKT